MRLWIIALVAVLAVSLGGFWICLGKVEIREVRIPCGTRLIEGLLVSGKSQAGKSTVVGHLAVCSHGTNSHKEVFLPLAFELAKNGMEVVSLDSPELSTEEGLPMRVEEIAASIEWAASQGIFADRISLVGHSDGVPPSLAAAKPGGKHRISDAIVLGSLFSPGPGPDVRLRGFVGAFDQIFPVERMRESAEKIPIVVPWLSDHFTEQYDPLLIEGVSNALNDRKPEGFPIGPIALIFFLALGVMAAFGLGTLFSELPTFWVRLSAVFFPIALWSIFPSIFPEKVLVTAFLAGAVVGRIPSRVWPLIGQFFLLMLANVVLTTREFWGSFPWAVPWLFVLVPWYTIAWVVKVALFASALLHKADPSGWTAFPMVGWILAGLAAAMSGGLAGFCANGKGRNAVGHGATPTSLSESGSGSYRNHSFPPETSGERSGESSGERFFGSGANDSAGGRVAFGLLLAMAVLWGIRFKQGMVQWEILSSVAENYLRMLVFPTVYLVVLVRRAFSK